MNIKMKEKADQIYEKVKDELEGHEGKLMAIEVESGDYFLGKTTTEAYKKARTKYPHKKFFFKRVGFRTAHFVGGIKV